MESCETNEVCIRERKGDTSETLLLHADWSNLVEAEETDIGSPAVSPDPCPIVL